MKNRIETHNKDIGTNIIQIEFVKALSKQKKGKAPGTKRHHGRIIKNVGKDTECKQFEIIGKIYRYSNILKDFTKS